MSVIMYFVFNNFLQLLPCCFEKNHDNINTFKIHISRFQLISETARKSNFTNVIDEVSSRSVTQEYELISMRSRFARDTVGVGETKKVFLEKSR